MSTTLTNEQTLLAQFQAWHGSPADSVRVSPYGDMAWFATLSTIYSATLTSRGIKKGTIRGENKCGY